MLVMPLRMLGMSVGQAQRATASGERFFEVIDEPEEISDRAGRCRAARGAGPRSASRASRSPTTARGGAEGIDLEIEAGSTIALIGASGSGKTTLASLVPRLYDAQRGARPDRRRRRARRRRGGRCAARSASSRRTRSSSPRPSARTSPSAAPTPPEESRRPPARRRRTRSSRSCRTATTRSSASAGSRSPAASASGSRSRGRC